MTDALFLALGILTGGLVGWFLGRHQGRQVVQEHLEALIGAVRSGQLPEVGKGEVGELPAIDELRRLLARSWVPRGTEREEANREALKRLAGYLRHRVEAPLLEGLDAGGEGLRSGADAALDAVEDLEFFLEDPPLVPVPKTVNLVDLVSDVAREFQGQFTVHVNVDAPPGPFRAQVDPEPLKDAVFLVLHNAGEFGGGQPVALTLKKEAESVRILIRDKGPGFSPDALLQALNPFYTTAPAGLGLGLPYARTAVTAQGGDLVLRNAVEGGAEVEIILPLRG